MPSKRQRNQRNFARAASILTFKKKRLEASQLPKPVQPQPDNNIINTSNTKGKSGTWYWNKSANKSCFNTKEEGYSNVKEEDETKTRESKTKTEESKKQNKATPDGSLRWNRDGESSFCERYRKGSKSSSQRLQKLAQDFKKKASQTYNIQALWQWGQSLGLTSMANSQLRPGKPSQLLPIDSISSAFPLSDISQGEPPLVSKQETYRIQQVEALKDINRLLELVTKQDKKYVVNFYLTVIFIDDTWWYKNLFSFNLNLNLDLLGGHYLLV